jgi:hypothetical protein
MEALDKTHCAESGLSAVTPSIRSRIETRDQRIYFAALRPRRAACGGMTSAGVRRLNSLTHTGVAHKLASDGERPSTAVRPMNGTNI